MKTKMFTTLCILFSVSVSAQTYFPFIETGKTWADITIFDNTVSPVVIWTDYYKFGDDTLIQGKLYHSLLSCHRDSAMTNWNQEGSYYREDSNKVYRANDLYWEDDLLLYNFNLIEGDSVLIDSFYGYAHVSHVDSTLVCGAYHKTIHFDYPPDIWVEGIGSLYSTFEPLIYHFYTDNLFQLLCANDSICQLYQNPSYSGCYIDTTILAQHEKTITKPAILVSPNPAVKNCNIVITGTTEHFWTLLLIDNKGRIVRKETHPENSFVFDRKDLPSGLYLMRVFSNDIILNKKIIIE